MQANTPPHSAHSSQSSLSDISQGNDTADMHSDTVSIASSTEIDAQPASLPSSASSSHSSIFATPNTSSDAMPAPLTERATPSSAGPEASTVMQQIANDVASETARGSIASTVNSMVETIIDNVAEQSSEAVVQNSTLSPSPASSHDSMNDTPSGAIITRTGHPSTADNVGSQMMGMGAFNPDFSGTQPPATIITRTGQPTDIDELGSTMFGFGALDARNTVSQETPSPSESRTGIVVLDNFLNWGRNLGFGGN